jgi:hypothetical protein
MAKELNRSYLERLATGFFVLLAAAFGLLVFSSISGSPLLSTMPPDESLRPWLDVLPVSPLRAVLLGDDCIFFCITRVFNTINHPKTMPRHKYSTNGSFF